VNRSLVFQSAVYPSAATASPPSAGQASHTTLRQARAGGGAWAGWARLSWA
jgi:hypothetical protein